MLIDSQGEIEPRQCADSGSNHVWGCFGASLGAWASFASKRAYKLLTTMGNNALLVRVDAYSRGDFGANWTDDMWCHRDNTHRQLPRLHLDKTIVRRWTRPHGSAHGGWNRTAEDKMQLQTAIRQISRRCQEHETPYTLRIGNQCCGGSSHQLQSIATQLCRCTA